MGAASRGWRVGVTLADCSRAVSVWVLMSAISLRAKALSATLGGLAWPVGVDVGWSFSSVEGCGTMSACGVIPEGCVSKGMFTLQGSMQHERCKIWAC